MKLRARVRDVEREVRSECATPVVRPYRRDEATGRLPGTGRVGGGETERLADVVRVADEVVWVAVLESRLRDVSENHAVTERQIWVVVVRDGRTASSHEQHERADAANHQGGDTLDAKVRKHASPPLNTGWTSRLPRFVRSRTEYGVNRHGVKLWLKGPPEVSPDVQG